MKKVSDKLIIKQLNGSLELIQTGQDFTFIEKSVSDNTLDAYVCVDTTKFCAIFNEEKSTLDFKDDYLEVRTGRSKGLLPYMKEYGVFTTDKELEVSGEISDSFEVDYSDVDLDLSDATDQFSYILFNRDFVCRYLYNTMSFYSDIPETWYNITPKQFKILKSMGKVNIEIYENTYLKASNADNILVLRLYSSVINLNTIKKFFSQEPVSSFCLKEIDYKKLKIFLKDYDVFNLIKSGDYLTFAIDSYCEDFKIESIEIDSDFNVSLFKKDLENLFGSIKFYSISGIKYIISKPAENKTVLFTCER